MTVFSQTKIIDAQVNYDFTNLNCDCTHFPEAEEINNEIDEETGERKIALKCICGTDNNTDTRQRISVLDFASLPFEEKTKSLIKDDIVIGDRVFSPRNWVYQLVNLRKFSFLEYNSSKIVFIFEVLEWGAFLVHEVLIQTVFVNPADVLQ